MSTKLARRWRFRVFGLVLTVPPLLYVVPVHRLIGRIGGRRASYQSPPVDGLVLQVDDWLSRLPRPWRTTCLKRSAILYALLRRSGEDVQLHIGVKREADRTFAAHAWLMKNNEPYLEPPTSAFSTYQVITVFPEPATPTAAPLPTAVP
ncbi:MAG: lasso peptide biosynthesis B2 protein [Gemmatimonadaceae bacterium]